MSVKIIDKDLGYKEIKKNLQEVDKNEPFVKVGFLESAGTHSDSGLTVATVATFQEFGTEKIPERSFMRSTQLEKQAEISAFIGDQANLWVDLKLSTANLLERIGLKVQSLIRQRIRSITQPPLADSTVAAKGSTKPLIDTGQMINSVNYEKVMK